MKKKNQDIALIKYYDNGQISKVEIRDKETDLIKKHSKYDENGSLVEQFDYNYLPDKEIKLNERELVDFLMYRRCIYKRDPRFLYDDESWD